MQYNTAMLRLQTILVLTLAVVAQATPPTIGSCPVLPADNIWNTPIDQLPLDANSATYVATIGSGTTLHADFGAGLYAGGPIGIPFVTVPGTQTKYPATFLYADESDARPYASSLTDPKYPPMGQHFRLKASFDISSFSAEDQVILRAMKKYGMMIADNGSAWFISGAPDDRWNNTNLGDLRRVVGSDFEAVHVSSLLIHPNPGQ